MLFMITDHKDQREFIHLNVDCKFAKRLENLVMRLIPPELFALNKENIILTSGEGNQYKKGILA